MTEVHTANDHGYGMLWVNIRHPILLWSHHSWSARSVPPTARVALAPPVHQDLPTEAGVMRRSREVTEARLAMEVDGLMMLSIVTLIVVYSVVHSVAHSG